jgi:hypothetical protein
MRAKPPVEPRVDDLFRNESPLIIPQPLIGNDFVVPDHSTTH